MKLIRPILIFIMQILQMVSGTVNTHVRPVILFLQSVKGFVFGNNEVTTDNILESFRQTLGQYYNDFKHWFELYVRAVLEVMPDAWKKDLDLESKIDVFLRSIDWLRSIDNKWLVYGYILNIATRMAIMHMRDDQVRFSEVQTIVQTTYVKMKIQGELPRVSISVSDNLSPSKPVHGSRKSGKGRRA